LQAIKADPARLAVIRGRLSHLSWFMRCLAEPIARAVNVEEESSGRFWQGRFKSLPLLDEPALIACLAYVDLNPIRARLAETPETSPFTSVFERLHAQLQYSETAPFPQGHECPASYNHIGSPAGTVGPVAAAPAVRPLDPAHSSGGRMRGDWLSPFEASESAASAPVPAARASNKGCVPMRFADYLALLDWTRSQLRPGGGMARPAEPAPLLKRLCVTGEGWLRLVKDFSRLFRRAAGTPASLRLDTDKWGRRRMTGISHSRAIFV
jgi:hypothetical protein